MTIIDEIKAYTKAGKLPIVQDNREKYGILTLAGGHICLVSYWEEKKEDLSLGIRSYAYSTEEILISGWHIVGQFDIPLVPFTVGQSVKVREDLAEVFDVSDFDTCKKSFIGKIYTIESVDSRSSGLSYDINGYSFRHDWLLPVLETKRTVDDVLAGLSDEDKEIIRERLR